MTTAIDINVENKLVKEKRHINVYHHATRGAHIISHNGAISLPLGTKQDDDYLHISITRGPGNMWKPCILDLPNWADFELSSEGTVTLNHFHDHISITIPAGPPNWQLKITRNENMIENGRVNKTESANYNRITIHDPGTNVLL